MDMVFMGDILGARRNGTDFKKSISSEFSLVG